MTVSGELRTGQISVVYDASFVDNSNQQASSVRTSVQSEGPCKMTTVTLEVAQANLPELIDHPGLSEVLVITRDHQPIARLQAEGSP